MEPPIPLILPVARADSVNGKLPVVQFHVIEKLPVLIGLKEDVVELLGESLSVVRTRA
jgi:hypothetical protein